VDIGGTNHPWRRYLGGCDGSESKECERGQETHGDILTDALNIRIRRREYLSPVRAFGSAAVEFEGLTLRIGILKSRNHGFAEFRVPDIVSTIPLESVRLEKIATLAPASTPPSTEALPSQPLPPMTTTLCPLMGVMP
jgi:hypothetical protein